MYTQSFHPERSELQGIWSKVPSHPRGILNSNINIMDPNAHHIAVRSTFDADIVLRKIIEDRVAILALRGKVAKNEAELMKAKAWQLQINTALDSHDEVIAKQIAKARRGMAEYNESSKQYIRGFVSAFENGDIEKLPRHPFLPTLRDLEDAISRRRAALIEKNQADNRVQKLELIKSQHHITHKVLKKNEEAFLRAIALAKQQFSDSCGSWLLELDKLISDLPSHSQRSDSDKVSDPFG